MRYAKIKGFADLLAKESATFTRMENIARTLFFSYGFTELRTPILEYTDLFARSIGEETDVVHKEMYTFSTEKGRSLSLRPEATAGVMRAYIENSLYASQQLTKLFTTGPMFRHERPQKGRQRQFHQINCECLGSESPLCDAELICMLVRYLKELGVKDTELQINSLGCPSCRPQYKNILKEYLANIPENQLCEDCLRRRVENPLRVLDCKQESCKKATEDAPHFFDCLCEDCQNHFERVRQLLQQEKVAFVMNHRLVRGLDYYCKTTFEVVSGGIGSQSAIAGGGRYDGLVESLGGPKVPGIGFACGMERIALLLEQQELPQPDFYLVAMDDLSLTAGFVLVQELRASGLSGEMNLQVQGFKSLMRQADKSRARYCLILGSEEREQGQVTIKNMRDGSQQKVALQAAAAYLNAGK